MGYNILITGIIIILIMTTIPLPDGSLPSLPPQSQRQPSFEETIKQRIAELQANQTFKHLNTRICSCLAGSFLGSYLTLGRYYKAETISKAKTGLLPKFRYVLFSTYFLQTSITFTSKILIDAVTPDSTLQQAEYLRGLLVGVISFVINTPIKHIYQTQSKIVDSRHKRISKIMAFSFMVNTYGSKSLYAGRLGTNLLNLFNSTLFYSLYFGVNSTLSEQYSQIPYKYLINPFIAALTATIPTFIIGHIGNTYSSIEMKRYIIARESGRRLMPPAKQSVLLETVKTFGGLFRISVQKQRLHVYSFLTNWLMLALFTSIQHEMSHEHKKSPGADFALKAYRMFQLPELKDL